MWGRSGLTAIAVVAAAGAAACSGSGSADAGHTLPPLSSPASSAAQSPTPDPAHLGKKQELAAAEATVRRYFRVLNALDERMDARTLAVLLTKSCKCRKLVSSTRYYAAKGDRFVQKGHIERMGGDANARSAQVIVAYSATAGGIRIQGGDVISRTPAVQHAEVVFYLTTEGTRWLIANIQELR